MARNYDSEKKPFSSEQVIGRGNATSDPVMFSGKGKSPAVSLRVAANSRSIDKNGDVVEYVVFRNIKAFGSDAEYIMDNVEKGNQVEYRGRLSPVAFTRKDGEEVTEYEVLLDSFGLKVTYKKDEEGGSTRRRNDDDDDAPTRSRGRRARRDDDDEDDDAPTRTRSKAKSRAKEEDYDDDDYDDEDVDLEDDDEQEAPRSRSRSRARSTKSAPAKRSRSKKVESDLDDDDPYMETVI